MLTALILSPSLVFARLGMTAVELTEANFNEYVHQFDRLVVDFYDSSNAEWQQHQKELESALVTVRKIASIKTNFAKVDVSKNPNLGTQFVKNGHYPQLVWFAHGKTTQYHRTLRHADAIVQFVLAMDRPAVASVTSLESVGDYNMVVLAEMSKKSAFYKTSEAVALRHMDAVAFLHMESDKNTISFYKNGTLDQQYEGEHDVEAVHNWIMGQLPLQSEDIPAEEAAMDDGVLVVVGKTFEKLVLQKDKDVMLVVGAPWCGHCRLLRPVLRQVQQAVSHMPHIVMAEIDGDRNQSPLPNDFVWDSFPTVFYVRAGETSPKVYRGDRTAKTLLDFTKEHSSQPFEEAKQAGTDNQDGTDNLYDL